MAEQRVTVVVNPAAGAERGMERSRRVVAELAERGFVVDMIRLSSPDDLAEVIDHHSDRGQGRIILAGGDGLVHSALPLLAGSGLVVGLVPVGTGNDFCRGLGLPSKRSAAIEAAVSDRFAPVDLIAVARSDGGQALAATVLTAGFSGRVNHRADAMAFPRGSSRYTIATLAELRRLKPSRFRIGLDNETPEDVEATLVAVGNTAYFGGGMAVCPGAAFDDGWLEVVIVDPVSAFTLAQVLPRVFWGRHVSHPAVRIVRARRLSLVTTEELWADGELLESDAPGPDGSACVEISVRPAALLVAGVS